MEKLAIEYKLNCSKRKRFVSEQLLNSDQAARYARLFYGKDIMIYESAFIIMLNSQKRVMGYAKISQGGCVGTCVDCVIVAKYAVDSLAQGIIFVHNHPSGIMVASTEDDKITQRINQCLKVFGIALLDHIIISPESHYSYADRGKI